METDIAINIAENSLDVVSKVFSLGSALSDVSEIVKISGLLGSAFPVVGAILSLIGNFLPDRRHNEILSRFRGLSTKIDRVRDDIKNLRNDIGWEMTEHHYRDAVSHIALGMKLCVDIGRASGQNRTRVARERLENHCDNSFCVLHLDKLLEGMNGDGLLTSSSILDKFDVASAKGDRKRLSSLATRLLQVASGGIMVIATYETMMYGEDEARHFIEQHGYTNQLTNASLIAQSLLDRCVDNFRQNMLDDLNTFLDTGRPNMKLTDEITNFMSDKYDWLENFVLVYDDLWGFDKHCIGGQRVNSLHRNGKCGVVYYRIKGESPRYSDRYYEASGIVHSTSTLHAQHDYNDIQDKIIKNGIGRIGLAVIGHAMSISWWSGYTQHPNHLSWAGKFSTQIVTVDGKTCPLYPSSRSNRRFLCTTTLLFLQ